MTWRSALALGFALGAVATTLPAYLPQPAREWAPAHGYAAELSQLDRTGLRLRRARLLSTVWPDGRLPSVRPAVAGNRLHMDVAGVRTAALVRTGGDRAVIYHRGHGGDEASAAAASAALIAAGYTVVEMGMPLVPPNEQPTLEIPGIGPVRLTRHDLLALVPDVHPLRFFLEPVAAVVNHLEAAGHREISMMGLSGGGWTTTVYAAIDTRIRRSYPVAGSLPVPLRIDDLGDFEQLHPDLLSIVSYPELYVMGAAGRRQLQILNRWDSCCFSSVHAPSYADAVARAARRLGGSFAMLSDSTHRDHKVSKHAMRIILEDMGS